MPARQHGAFAERLRANADLANTLALNARARYLGLVSNTTDCAQALDFARTHERQHELPLLLLGAGSNVVLPANFSGLALSVAQRDWQIVAEQGDSVWVECAGGANWHRFVLWCSANNCFGLENLALSLAALAQRQCRILVLMELSSQSLLIQSMATIFPVPPSLPTLLHSANLLTALALSKARSSY